MVIKMIAQSLIIGNLEDSLDGYVGIRLPLLIAAGVAAGILLILVLILSLIHI